LLSTLKGGARYKRLPERSFYAQRMPTVWTSRAQHKSMSSQKDNLIFLFWACHFSCPLWKVVQDIRDCQEDLLCMENANCLNITN
jgi:hypothetical protein